MATSQQMQKEDTEITLTTGKVLAIFFVLSAICAVFFAMGFLFGKNSVKASVDASPVQTGVSTHADAPKPSTSPQPASSSSQAAATDASSPAPANVKPETPAASDTAVPPPAADPTAPPPLNGYYVQVAAVSKQEDADALIDALKKKQYPAFLPEGAPDKLFHVQIGPFADIKDAEGIRSRLLSDGYNPIIKK